VASRTKSILIAALGGEGGGVLSDWTLTAIRNAGYLAQSTSIPGVAQRTGATTYYIEYSAIPLAELGTRRPVFALTPVPGQVDVMMASELIEAARAAQIGYISPDRTTMIASAHRVFATSEKIAMNDGRFDSEAALRPSMLWRAVRFIFDMEKAAEQAGTVINAVLFGALAGANVLEIERRHFEQAIKISGKSLDANMRGFELWIYRGPRRHARCDDDCARCVVRCHGRVPGISVRDALYDRERVSAMPGLSKPFLRRGIHCQGAGTDRAHRSLEGANPRLEIDDRRGALSCPAHEL